MGILKAIIKLILPKRLWNHLLAYVQKEFRNNREARERQIRKVPLTEEHMKNCVLLLNRSDLLSRLPKGGIVAELGVNRGEFTEAIVSVTAPAMLHLVDMWGTDRYHDGLFEEVSGRFKTGLDSGSVEIHRKLSTEAVDDFSDSYFDWVYIDTSHRYEVTLEELIRFAPKMKPEGIIAGHDYSMGNWVSSIRYGVIEAVHEFAVEYGWELVHLTIEPTENQSFALRRMKGADKDN